MERVDTETRFPLTITSRSFLLGVMFALTAAFSLVLPKDDRQTTGGDRRGTSDQVELMPANSKRLDKEAPALH
jgi:hypothetical protein